MDAIRPKTYSSKKEADAWGLFDKTMGTLRAYYTAHEKQLTYLRRFKCDELLTGDERVAERLVYSRFFDTHARDRTSNGVDGLLATLNDKRLEVSPHAAAKAHVLA
jgi:hypothetical protein